MVAARDLVRAPRAVADEDKPGLAPLCMGDLVVGQHPKSKEWSLDGEVTEVTHSDRAYIVTYLEEGNGMFARLDLKLDKTRRFDYKAAEKRELEKHCKTWGEKPGASSTTQPRAESGPRRSNCLLSKRAISFMEPLVSSSNEPGSRGRGPHITFTVTYWTLWTGLGIQGLGK